VANKDRSSEAEDIDTVLDPKKIAHIEAENTLKQFDAAMIELDKWISDPSFVLRPSLILKLHRIALAGLSKYAGVFRPGGIKITGSNHVPISGDEVPERIEEFCDYINEKWHEKSAMHLSA
jgi:Fic family protein